MAKQVQNILMTEAEIKQMVERIAAAINRDYQGEEVVLIGVLRGAVVFLTDLIRALDIDLMIDFISVSSYQGTKSTGVVRIEKDTDIDISGKHVILVEDIVDTGLTLKYLQDLFGRRKPRSLKICAAFNKKDCRTVDVPVDYIGCDIPNAFVVGYGLDYNQKYRNLPFLGILGDDAQEDAHE